MLLHDVTFLFYHHLHTPIDTYMGCYNFLFTNPVFHIYFAFPVFKSSLYQMHISHAIYTSYMETNKRKKRASSAIDLLNVEETNIRR